MNAVINASPIIFLHKIERLWILEKLFVNTFVPLAVQNEILGCADKSLESALSSIPIQRLNVINQTAVRGLLGRLHAGEVEVIIGALENDISIVVLDDMYARNKAAQLGLTVTGTLGLLLKAKNMGLIENIGDDITGLKKAGMYITDAVIEKILPL